MQVKLSTLVNSYEVIGKNVQLVEKAIDELDKCINALRETSKNDYLNQIYNELQESYDSLEVLSMKYKNILADYEVCYAVIGDGSALSTHINEEHPSSVLKPKGLS